MHVRANWRGSDKEEAKDGVRWGDSLRVGTGQGPGCGWHSLVNLPVVTRILEVVVVIIVVLILVIVFEHGVTFAVCLIEVDQLW
jgi:hypothetical protein